MKTTETVSVSGRRHHTSFVKDRIKDILNKKWRVAFFEKLSGIVQNFSVSEKVVFYGLSAILVISGLVALEQVNRSVSVDVPTDGGTLTEGIVGSPRFVNPVLAVSDVDQDLTELVYSGLMKATPNDTLVPDLAASYTISSSSLVYTFTIRNNAYFSDGVKVTADDIVYTINEIQDSAIKSPELPAFYDVKVDKISNDQVQFTLKQPYAAFLQNLTVGILPKHIWGNLSDEEFPLSQYNVEPIGSGPYKVENMKTLQKDMQIIPTYYELTPFSGYALGKPFINDLIVNFYPDEKTLIGAYNAGNIESMNSIDPANVATVKKQNNAVIATSPLPRVFAVFFNQNQSDPLADLAVRQALNEAVDRDQIVSDVLFGYGKPIDGPIPAGFVPGEVSTRVQSYNFDQASSTLAKDGWVKNPATGILEKKIGKKTIPLAFSISTLNSPDLVKTAEIVASGWQELGVQVDVKQYELGDLEQNVIRPRKFDALLYGLVTGRDMDFFAFWDSSQRNDPGLNISMYTSSRVDKLLEDARGTLDTAKQDQDYLAFESDVRADVPAVFLYSPEFIYVVPRKIQGLSLGTITLPFERFLDIEHWYIETNNLWKIFQKA